MWHLVVEELSLLAVEGLGLSLLTFPSAALWLVRCPSTALWLVGSSMHLAAGINSAPCPLALARQWRVLALGIRLASSDFAQRLETEELPFMPVAMGPLVAMKVHPVLSSGGVLWHTMGLILCPGCDSD